jgi:predicted lipoprotein with Yx(FWY)xxD motif
MNRRRGSILTLLAVPVVAIAIAACGGSSSNSSAPAASNASQSTAATSGGTVSTKSVSGVGTVLVDSKGMALYTNDQDTSSKVACTGQCQSFWIPLKASGGKPTSADSAVQSKLGMLQGIVTFDGKPLYTFVQDTSPGQVNGNGFQDSFGGKTFTWAAATTSGSAASSAPTSTSSSSGGSAGGYGGSAGSSSSGGSSGGYAY